VCAWVNNQWEFVNHEPSVKSSKKYGISYTSDGAEDEAQSSKKIMADYNIHNDSVTLTTVLGFYKKRPLYFTLAF
jgi:hypothetical protein